MFDTISNGRNQKEKRIIAFKALQLIEDGNTIFMDGGSTNQILAANLPSNISLRVITNNLTLIPILSKRSNIELILLGGAYHNETQTTLDYFSNEFIENYVADNYFLGACAIDEAYGLTTSYKEEIALKRMMRLFSKRTIVLVDDLKLNTQKPFKICTLDEVDILITNLSAQDYLLEPYRDCKAVIH